jgi:hypothetical protein
MSSTDDKHAAELLNESYERLLESVDPSRLNYENSVGKVKEVIAHMILWEVEAVSTLLTLSRDLGYQSDDSVDTNTACELQDISTQRLYSAWEGRELLRGTLTECKQSTVCSNHNAVAH